MGWLTMMLGLTVLETLIAAYIFVVYHGDPSISRHFPSVTPESMARLVIYVQGFNLLLLGAVDKLAGFGNGFFFQSGGAGQNRYSRERGMARSGDREAACERLAKAVSRRGDFEALRVLVELATEEPRLQLWVSKAAGLRGKVKKISREDLASLDMMLGRTMKIYKETA